MIFIKKSCNWRVINLLIYVCIFQAPKKHHRSFAELEADAEFLNLSCQSPTFLDMHSAVQSRYTLS